jgi:hypothetical protein
MMFCGERSKLHQLDEPTEAGECISTEMVVVKCRKGKHFVPLLITTSKGTQYVNRKLSVMKNLVIYRKVE